MFYRILMFSLASFAGSSSSTCWRSASSQHYIFSLDLCWAPGSPSTLSLLVTCGCLPRLSDGTWPKPNSSFFHKNLCLTSWSGTTIYPGAWTRLSGVTHDSSPVLLSYADSHAQSLQSCLTLCDPMDYSPLVSFCPWGSPGKNTGVGCHVLFQGIFPTQEVNPHLLHWRQILYALNHLGSPFLSYYQANYEFHWFYLEITFWLCPVHYISMVPLTAGVVGWPCTHPSSCWVLLEEFPSAKVGTPLPEAMPLPWPIPHVQWLADSKVRKPGPLALV